MSDRECKNNLLASSAAVTSLGADSTSISAALADLALLSFYSIMGSEVLWSFQAKKCRPYERPLNHLAAAALALHSSTESPPISYSNIVRYWPFSADHGYKGCWSNPMQSVVRANATGWSSGVQFRSRLPHKTSVLPAL